MWLVYVTSGNDMRLLKSDVKYDIRKFGFCSTSRVVKTWNSLPSWVVYELTLQIRLKVGQIR